MNTKLSLSFAALALASSTSLQAQDLFGSANSATRSYNYVEIQYLPEMDTNLPLLATLVVGVTDGWSVWGKYLKRDIENIGGELGLGSATDADADVSLMALGLLYHNSFKWISDSDWVAGFIVGRSEVTANIPVFSAEVTRKATVHEAYLGLRRTLAPKLEGEIGVDVFHDDGNYTTTGEVKLVYRVLPAIDVAVGVSEISDGDNLGIGLRYTW